MRKTTSRLPGLSINKKSRVEQVYDHLRLLTTGPGMAVGDRLQPVRILAQRFGTSVPTVQRALAQLETEGLVQCRQGSGVYVASCHEPLVWERSVALCMEIGSEISGELTARLLRLVQERDGFATLVDTAFAKSDALLHRMSHTGASCLVIQGNLHFPFDVLLDPTFRKKPVVSILNWETDLVIPDVHHVVSDFTNGAQQVADHLRSLGHRRVLVVGTSNQIHYLTATDTTHRSPLPRSFASAWKQGGGTWCAQQSRSEGHSEHLEEGPFLAHFDGPDAPTAIFGLRDREAHLAQRILRRMRPELAARIAIVGYYDTTWAVASDPPLTAVSLNLPELAKQTMTVLEPILAGRHVVPSRVAVPPILTVRGTSHRAL